MYIIPSTPLDIVNITIIPISPPNKYTHPLDLKYGVLDDTIEYKDILGKIMSTVPGDDVGRASVLVSTVLVLQVPLVHLQVHG